MTQHKPTQAEAFDHNIFAENSGCCRRNFLRGTVHGVAAITGLWLLTEGTGCIVVKRHVLQVKPQGKTLLIPAEKLDVLKSASDVLEIRIGNQEDPILIRRGNHGYIALSSTCTHRGCELESHPNSYECPCHGSRFDLEGQVQVGPATRNLDRFPLRKTERGWELQI